MKKTIAIIVVVLFTFALASVSLAADKNTKMANPIEKARIHYVKGKVKAVDTLAQSLTITKMLKGKEEETVMTIDKGTSITMGREKLELADVKIGEKVTVMYTELNGKNVAKSVAVRHAKKIAKVESKKKIVESGKETGK